MAGLAGSTGGALGQCPEGLGIPHLPSGIPFLTLTPDSRHATLRALHTPLPSPCPENIPHSKFHSVLSLSIFMNPLNAFQNASWWLCEYCSLYKISALWKYALNTCLCSQVWDSLLELHQETEQDALPLTCAEIELLENDPNPQGSTGTSDRPQPCQW